MCVCCVLCVLFCSCIACVQTPMACPALSSSLHPQQQQQHLLQSACGQRHRSGYLHPLLLQPARWERGGRVRASRAQVTCIGGDMNKRDAARKALEAALGEKKDSFSKWDEEIKKREAGGGGGGRGRGRGWGGGDGGGESSSSESNSWEEAKQILYAFTGLAALYLVLTKGKSMLAFTVNSILFILRGFKNPSSSSSPSSSGAPALSGPIGVDGPGTAESNVMNKWGKD